MSPTVADAEAPATRMVRLNTAAARWFAGLDRFDLVLLLTLAFQIVYVEGFAEFPIQAVAMVAVVLPSVRGHWAPWVAIIGLHLVGTVPFQWAILANHEWLALWWLVAVAGATLAGDPQAALARAAKLMLGLVFLFATSWKIMAPDFVSGDYFEFLLQSDERVGLAGVVVGGLEPEAAERNRDALFSMAEPLGPDEVVLEDGSRVALLADVLALSTVAVEGLLAAAFLAPASSRVGRRLGRHRDAVLLGFVAVTYPLAPVVSFAWVLLAMLLAQARSDVPRWDLGVAVTFAGLHVVAQGSIFHDIVEGLL